MRVEVWHLFSFFFFCHGDRFLNGSFEGRDWFYSHVGVGFIL